MAAQHHNSNGNGWNANTILLTILLGLGSWTLAEVTNLGTKVAALNVKVLDLQHQQDTTSSDIVAIWNRLELPGIPERKERP